MVTFAQVGNFEPDHSTENELRKAIGLAGHDVETFQENKPGVFRDLEARIGEFDVVLWTRTGWDPPVPHDQQFAMLAAAAHNGVPTVGYHLDRWFGLHREGQVSTEPFFRVQHLFTADGGHDDRFARLGVHHRWLPPGVSEVECIGGTPRPEYESDLVFVGSWQPGYHREWKHRPQLVRFLRREFGDRTAFWPKPGEHAVRGEPLRDLYASVKIAVGDSCLSGGATRYWSDRIPETMGRGAFLIHPWVEGIDEHFTPGLHLITWHPNDWDDLRSKLGRFLADDEGREQVAAAGRAHVLAHHTYTVRIRQILEMVL